MKLVFSLFLALFILPAGADAGPDEFSKWMMNYYQSPSPNTVVPEIRKAAELHLLKDIRKAGPPLFGFIAGVTRNNKGLARALVKELSDIEESQYGVILVGIWYANLPNNESKDIVSNELKSRPVLKDEYPFLSGNPVDLLSVSPKRGPWVLDAMWGYFFATGSEDPVLSIISVLPWIDDSKKDEVLSMGKPGLYLMATSGAAKWSLTSNAKQHELVMNICNGQIGKQPELISKQLREIVKQAGQG